MAARCNVSAKVVILHGVDTNVVELMTLTPEHMATLSMACIISGLYEDGSFFVGLPGMLLTGSDIANIQIGNFPLQCVVGSTADEAVEKLGQNLKHNVWHTPSTTNSQHE